MLKTNDPQQPFDFDRWMQLARHDPAAFERQRRETIKAYFAEVPSARHSQLYRLQWRIDMEIFRSRSALGACIRLHRMMMDSLQRQRAALESLLTGTAPPNLNRRARVIPFPGRRQP